MIIVKRQSAQMDVFLSMQYRGISAASVVQQDWCVVDG
jgi:hypothetical protein